MDGELKMSHLVFGVMARSSAAGVTLKPVSIEVSRNTGTPPPSTADLTVTSIDR